MGQKKSIKQVTKLITYILGRRPDEFGLMPDAEGFVKIKSLLQVLGEEPGWGFVRRSHLEEILAVMPAPGIEIRDNRIRAVDRRHLVPVETAPTPPGQLFVCVRRRAYAHVLEKGIFAAGAAHLLLSDSKALALRMGRRLDPDPVLLTVAAQDAQKKGVVFFKTGESLYLADAIPPGCFSGPPLPKEKAALPLHPKKKQRLPASAGGFLLQLDPKKAVSKPKKRSKDGSPPSWKRDRKRLRREKEKLRLKEIPPPSLGDIGGEDG